MTMSSDSPAPDREPLSPEDAWEQFALTVRNFALAPPRQDVNDALHGCEAAVENGERPSAEDVQAARAALDHARALVEDHYAELAPGVEPWGDGVGATVPHGVMIDHLEATGRYSVEKVSNRRESSEADQ